MTNKIPFSVLVILVSLTGCSKDSSTQPDKNNPPAAPSSPSPINASTGISTSPTLSWDCADPDGDALTYDVFFGTNNPPTTQVAIGQSVTTLFRTGLSDSTTYYWKVNAKNSKSTTTTGMVWSFTTGSGVLPGMVAVAGGVFTAGSTPVTISSFKIDNYEVTYKLWTDIRNWGLNHGYADLSTGRNGFNPVGTNNPVMEVNWYDIVKWCNARSEKDGLTPVYYTTSAQSTGTVYRTGQTDINNDAVKWNANGYRLPTEVEWEFAARGGTQTYGYTYCGSNAVGDVAWYYSNSGNSTHPVGQKPANELGIYDMSGNAYEWCWDWYVSVYPSGGTTDPKGPSTTWTFRAVRGGSFSDNERVCRVGVRSGMGYPGYQNDYISFRCVQH